jgi:transposase
LNFKIKEDIVSMKLKIIGFYDKYGLKATRDAFGISKSTIYEWKKRLKESGNNPLSLISHSKAPKNPRQREWHSEVVEYIMKRREECPRIGQEPLKKELEKFCKEKGIKVPSASTIARIIRYLKDK